MKRAFAGIAAFALCVPAFAADPDISVGTLKEVTKTLSSDAFEGRAPTTRGEDKTVGYIAGRFAAAGLQPANKGSWFQDVPMVRMTVNPATSLKITWPKYHKVERRAHVTLEVEITVRPLNFERQSRGARQQLLVTRAFPVFEDINGKPEGL